MENGVKIPQNTKIRTLIWFCNPTTGYIPRWNEINLSERWLHSHVDCRTIHPSQEMESTEVSLNRWMDKEMWHVHTIEYYWAVKKEWNAVICDNMDKTGEQHFKWDKPSTEKQILHVLTYMSKLKMLISLKWRTEQGSLEVRKRRNRKVAWWVPKYS